MTISMMKHAPTSSFGQFVSDCEQIRRGIRFDTRWQCACDGIVWPRMQGVRGTEAENTALAQAGFWMLTDSLGDIRYWRRQVTHLVMAMEHWSYLMMNSQDLHR